jgi:uncharacterized protein (UPF0254 family)
MQIKNLNNGVSDKIKERKRGIMKKMFYSALIGLSTLMPISPPLPNFPKSTTFNSQTPLLSSTLRADEGKNESDAFRYVNYTDIYKGHLKVISKDSTEVTVENVYGNYKTSDTMYNGADENKEP